ncbi:hypothetical protein RB597_004346 [Gaeumannomyces tritici]
MCSKPWHTINPSPVPSVGTLQPTLALARRDQRQLRTRQNNLLSNPRRQHNRPPSLSHQQQHTATLYYYHHHHHHHHTVATMVADALIYHPSVSHYLKFVATTVGRDKLLRTIQYFARFYAWYLLRTNGTPAVVAPWDALKKQFGLVRKVMRVGKNIEHVRAAAAAADAKAADPVVRYTSIGRQLGYAGYLTFDAATVLDAAGVRRSPRAARLQREAYRFWAMGLLCSVSAQLYALYRLKEREARVDRKEGEGVVEGKRIALERTAARTQLLSDLCDLTIPFSALGWVGLDDGIVGIAGTVSSVLGVIAQWKKTA